MKTCALLAVCGVAALSGIGLTAMVAFAPTPAPTPTAPIAAESLAPFAIDPVHSTAIFKIKHNDVATFYGRFNKMSGSFLLSKEAPESSTFDITIDMNTVDTAAKGRDEHLKKADFFSVAEFPTATFKSTSISKSADGSYDVTGDLTLRGVTKPITAKLHDTGSATTPKGQLAGVEGTFQLKRSDFGVNYMLGKGLSDEVTVMFGLEGRIGGDKPEAKPEAKPETKPAAK